MDYEKLKALSIAATHARTQEMLAADELDRAKQALEKAQSNWKSANNTWQEAKGLLDSFCEESIRNDAKTEADEVRECP